MESEYDFIVVGGRCSDRRIEFCPCPNDFQLEHQAPYLPRAWLTPQQHHPFFLSKPEARMPTPLINQVPIASTQPLQMDLL